MAAASTSESAVQATDPSGSSRRSAEIFESDHHAICRSTDRLFGWLMLVQWLLSIGAALLISPRTWAGSIDAVHIHVWTALIAGGVITALPVSLAAIRPGALPTRIVIGVAQMLMSALLIHLTGGRIETHFHVFGSLAFLAFYRDWRVLMPATAVTAVDHLVRGAFWPQSVFGVASASQWRWAEHAGWVLFEVAFLARSCTRQIAEMKLTATRQAQLETTNQHIEARVEEQTAEIAARESLFRSLTDSSPLGIFRTQRDPMQLDFCNDKCSSILGMTSAEFLARGWWRSIHASDRLRIIGKWRSTTAQHKDFAEEFRTDDPGSGVRWLQLSASPLSDRTGYVGTIDDITQSKEMESKQAWVGRMLEHSSNEIYIFDSDTLRFVQVNQGGSKNIGYTMDELRKMTPIDIKAGMTHAEFGRITDPLRSGQQSLVSFEAVHIRKDGTTYPVFVRLQLSEEASMSVFVAIILDMTDHQIAEKERARLTAAIEHAGDGILITSVNGTIEYVNPAFEKLSGYSRDEVLGRNPNLLKSGMHDNEFYADLWSTILAGSNWTGSLVNKRKDGTLFDSEATISPMRDSTGEVTHFVEVMRDVTEQKLMADQLRQAQKLESIGQLAAGIAHEINTPTQFVGDNTRFLEDAFGDLVGPVREIMRMLEDAGSDVPSEAARARLTAALQEADIDYLIEEIPRAIEQSMEGVARVTKIVRSMKEFSHPSDEATSTDLNRAIESTVTVARNEWKYVAELELDLDPAMGSITCYPGDINQVVLNMVVNAAHAIGDVTNGGADGKGRIRVQTKRSKDWAEIEISDTGSGIPEPIRTRIFDPFFTTKDVGKGTGQGFSIAHKLVVTKHRGQLEVESEEGEGSTFRIRLPFELQAAETPGVEA